MDRRDVIVGGLDLPRLRGIEIGPMSKPLVRREDGPILYVDQADTDTLRARYADQAHYDVAKIVEIDAVWPGGSLQEALGPDIRADYIVASHVIEHVPDLIRWLDELHSVLAPGGQIRLAIPDKRFIFDRPRSQTRLADVLAAWLERRTTPPPQAILDEMLSIAGVDWVAAWHGTLDDTALVKFHTPDAAIAAARHALATGSYRDTHCWVFTPTSFTTLMEELAGLGLLKLACRRFVDTPVEHYEFYATLEPADDAASIAESWRRALPAPLEPVAPKPAGMVALAEAERALATMHASASWRITAPLRRLGRAWPGRRRR